MVYRSASGAPREESYGGRTGMPKGAGILDASMIQNSLLVVMCMSLYFCSYTAYLARPAFAVVAFISASRHVDKRKLEAQMRANGM